MSYGGHIADMIRRDRENRELRRSLRHNDIFSDAVLGKKIDYSKLTLSKLEEIKKKTEEKEINETKALKSSMIRIGAICLFLVIVLFILFKIAGII